MAATLISAIEGVDTIVHLGAGKCSELPQYLAAAPRWIVLVEANPQAARALERQCAEHDNVQILQQAVAAQAGEHTLHVFNATELSSLHPATALQELFPGLRLVRQLPVDAIAPAELAQELDLQPGASNCLVVDIPGEEYHLLEALKTAQLLERFDRVVLRCGKEPLYDGAVSAEDALALLRELGYETAAQAEDADPDWPEWTLKLNPLKPELERLKALVEQLTAERDEERTARESLEASVREYETAIAQLSGERDDLRARVKDQTAEIERLQDAKQTAQDEQQKLKTNLSEEREAKKSLESMLAAERAQTERLESYLERFDSTLRELGERSEVYERQLQNVQSVLEKTEAEGQKSLTGIGDKVDRLESRLTKKIESAGQQVESYMGIQAFFDGRATPPSFHGWPVSPDFGLELVRMLEEGQYDLILEFGSGTTTVLVAKAIQKHLIARCHDWAEDRNKLEAQRSQASVATDLTRDRPTLISEESSVLPRKFIAFEHSQKYLDKTWRTLVAHGLGDAVTLKYAPLKDLSIADEGMYPFYDCEHLLASLADQLAGEQRQRILVVVDGPPGHTAKHARYPALPVVMHHLGFHKIDFLLDDYRRRDEKEIGLMWENYLDGKKVEYESESFSFEKGALLLSRY